MPVQLLPTKLYIPPLRSKLVSRPRLIEKLNQGLECPLTLVSAPAGYGKTTLLSAWLAQSGLAAAWLSLDAKDNDIALFLAYLLAALQKIHPDIGRNALAALQSPQTICIDDFVTALIGDLTQLPDPLVLILDDYHIIQAQSVHQAVNSLLEHQPPHVHLVISTRADPPFPLSRLRARSQMVELRLADLRFSSQEVAEFLSRVMGLELAKADIAALESRTEGWVASLQLAAISMQGRDPASFIQSFTGSHRLVLDYLIEQVFNQLAPDTQDFLLKTCVLERLSAPLCNAVTERDDGQAILNWLEQANLFLIPLDDERRWYRYHHLFADLLRGRLEQFQPDQPAISHRRAAQWYKHNGLIAEAVSHTLAAGDIDGLIRLVEANAYAMGDYDLSQLAKQLDALPVELSHAQPWVSVAQAWTWVHTGHLDAVENCLQEAEQAMAGAEQHNEAEVKRLLGHIAAIRGYSIGMRGNLEQSIKLFRQALEHLPKTDSATRSFAATMLSCTLRWTGCLVEATRASAEAVLMSRASGISNAMVNVLGDLAVLQIMQGKFGQAAATCKEALQVAEEASKRGGRQVPAAGQAYTFLSVVSREWNDLEAAVRYAREGVKLCRQWGHANDTFRASAHLARALQASGDTDGAWEAIREAGRVANDLSPWYAARAAVTKAWLHLMQGNNAAAIHWAESSGLNVGDTFDFEHHEQYYFLAQVLFVQGKLDQAGKLAEKLLQRAEAAGAMGYSVEVLALQALILSSLSNAEQAMRSLERALALAEPEGMVRTFVDQGAPMAALLHQARAQSIEPVYVNKLLAAFEGEPVQKSVTPAAAPPPASPLIEPLTRREIEVLKLLASGCSNKKIAEGLVISGGTVHKHLKNIYGKLGVHSRTEAIARARELSLL